ncbi:O-antigen ligase family protein [Megamonas hypermegale]|uniref:O-antigen ligase family protein n=1 Tax=Megamonas hypermegale TaxID=158847 RepID=UPI00195A9DD4|nr:O-antigen ligase family protein [Megamonas hypermegale]MBM6832725.1 O-antigen ligase family protein [Megamonas hypermegale]
MFNISIFLDKLIFICLILYSLTFLFDIPINLFTTAFILGILKLFFSKKPTIKMLSKHFYFIILFILCIFLSIIFNTSSSISIIQLLEYKSRFISPLMAFCLIFLFKITYKRILIILSGFSCSLLLNSIVIIYQFYIQSEHIPSRLVGFSTEHYMFLAGINLLILPIIFVLSIYKSYLPKQIKLLFLITILINIPAIVFENTRSVWLGLSILFPLIILFSIKNKIKACILIILLFLYSSLFFQLSPTSIQRFETIPSTNYKVQSNYERLLMWQSAFDMFKDYPITGVGISNYHTQYMQHYRSIQSREITWHPHNNLLYILSESGLLGGLSYIFLFIYLYYTSIKNYLFTKNIVTLSYLMSLIGFTINSFIDCVFCGYGLKDLTYLFWFFTGIYLLFNQYIIIKYKK